MFRVRDPPSSGDGESADCRIRSGRRGADRPDPRGVNVRVLCLRVSGGAFPPRPRGNSPVARESLSHTH